MNPTAVLAPVFALAAWTGGILVLLGFRRLRAGGRGQVTFRSFSRGEAPDVPEPVMLVNRNYMNLLELPLLFYVICLVAYATKQTSPVVIGLAWGYVGLRVVHSLIHVTYSRVQHRFAVFVGSNGVLVALWVGVGLAAFGANG